MAVVPFRAPARRRLHEDVAEQLRDAILDGRFAAGTKLPPERELAAEFDVNRTSIREAIKVLEGLGLVSVRQGDGATVRPLVDGTLEVLGPMIFHGGRVDVALVGEMAEVIRPLLLEMGRLAIERCAADDLDAIRRLRDRAADQSHSREERYRALHDLLVLLADMTRNRIWQMLGRRLRTLLQSEPLCAARARLRRDPGRFVPVIDSCLTALAARRTAAAVERLQQLIGMLGDVRVDLDAPRPKTRPQGRPQTRSRGVSR
jgi:GntR family transcriptional repressor for pyruvate dehydrogenase complex